MEKQRLGELGSYSALESIVNKLMAPDGCPWDREQTHKSLKKNLLEECYEFLEAIDNCDTDNMVEELGDILLQVVFHIGIGQENGIFRAEDVFDHVNRKLIRRHPHVFGDTKADNAQQVKKNWENIKQKERGNSSRLSGVPKTLPALAYAQLIQERASMSGFDWQDQSGALQKIHEEILELKNAAGNEEKEWELGDLLFSVVNLSRFINVVAEESLRGANKRFSKRFGYMENICNNNGTDFVSLPIEEKEKLWDKAKNEVG